MAAPNRLVCVCPKRFNDIDLLQLVLDHCWPFSKPQNPRLAREVTMRGFGNVDFVVADILDDSKVGNFVSVELQSVDITGSVYPAYVACVENRLLIKKPTYGLNWDNVYKRYMTQLIRKGYFHHHWGSKIVAFVQDVVYEDICSRAEFMQKDDVLDPSVNIIFAVCKYIENNGKYELALSKFSGTHHSQLQSAILYKAPPSREDFCGHIVRSLAS